MALRCNAANQHLNRTTSLPGTDPVTIMWWSKVASDLGAVDQILLGLGAATFDGANTYIVYFLDNGNLTFFVKNVSGTALNQTTDFVGKNKHFALVKNGTSAVLYIDGVSTISLTVGTGAISYTDLQFGNDVWNESINRADSNFAAIKIYEAALTASEIVNEMHSFVPVRTANLHAWWPCIDDTLANSQKDYSGNGRDFTLGAGNPTVEPGPPIVWAPRSRRLAAGAGGPGTLAASAIGQATAAAALLTDIRMNAAALASAGASAALTTAIRLAANALGQAAAAADLNVGGLVARAEGLASASAALLTQIALRSNAAALATAQVNLTTQIRMAANAAGSASASAEIKQIFYSPFETIVYRLFNESIVYQLSNESIVYRLSNESILTSSPP